MPSSEAGSLRLLAERVFCCSDTSFKVFLCILSEREECASHLRRARPANKREHGEEESGRGSPSPHRSALAQLARTASWTAAQAPALAHKHPRRTLDAPSPPLLLIAPATPRRPPSSTSRQGDHVGSPSRSLYRLRQACDPALQQVSPLVLLLGALSSTRASASLSACTTWSSIELTLLSTALADAQGPLRSRPRHFLRAAAGPRRRRSARALEGRALRRL